MMVEEHFKYDSRLQIEIPELNKPWGVLGLKERQMILLAWESIRGSIPDRIYELERKLEAKYKEMSEEECFSKTCSLNDHIAELASVIHDLQIWYRVNQDVYTEQKQAE